MKENRQSLILSLIIVIILGLTGCVSDKQSPEKGKNEMNVNSEIGTVTEQLTKPQESEALQTPATDSAKPSAGLTPEASPETEREYVITTFPTIFADFPDPDIIRVGEAYYMVSTTMHLCPGVPIMKSYDLVHWNIVNYVYDVFVDDDNANLENGKHMYSKGSWAASLKFDEASGLYYVAFNSNNHGFYIYTTDNIENGKWTKHFINGGFHDPALFIEDGHLYVITASGGSCRLQELLLDDATETVKTTGTEHMLFKQPSSWGLWEGAHAYHVGDYYYVFIIASPATGWFRTELCYRSKSLTGTDWEEKIVYRGSSGGESAGLAQGGIVQTQFGDWYGFLFQDRGGIGRVPSIVAVEWQDGWPIMGMYNGDGEFKPSYSEVVMKIYLPADKNGDSSIGNDEFDYENAEDLSLCWQWNHNPKKEYVSFNANPGFFRTTTDRTVSNIWFAHNSLTQRTYGKKMTAETMVLTDNMKPGDFCGIAAVADHSAMIGVICDDNGERHVFQGSSQFLEDTTINAMDEEAIKNGQSVILRVVYDKSEVTFEYSADGGQSFRPLGTKFSAGFSTSTTFMGTRMFLFNYATKESGGSVDFDYYHTDKK